MPDPVMEHARDVTIKLHHRVGRYVQLQLYFASKWIMLSEVSLISGMCVVHWVKCNCTGNGTEFNYRRMSGKYKVGMVVSDDGN